MAANEIAKLGYKVDSNGLLVADRRLKKTMDSSKKTESGIKELDRSFIGLSGAIGIAATALASFGVGSKLLNEARNFDVFMAQLKTATGGIENARAEFERLANFAATTPFNLGQSIDGFVKLKNLGLDPSIESMTSFGNTASAMGKSLSQMIEAVADASTNEFERLKEFGIKAKQETDRVIFTFQGVETAVAKNSEAIQKYLRDIGDVNFSGAMEDRANSLDGALSNLADTWDALFRAISNQGVGQAVEGGVRGATDAIQYLIDNMDALESSFKFLFASGAAYAAFLSKDLVVATIASAKAQLFAGTAATTHVGALGILTTKAAATTWQMNALGMATRFALGPWGLLIGAIGAAATVFVTSKNQAEEMNRKINDQKTAIDKLVESYGEMTKAGRGRFWQDSTSALQSNLAAQTDINMKMAEARSKLLANPTNAENEAIEIATLQRQLNELKEAYEQIHKERQALFTGPDESLWQSLEGSDDTSDSITGEINKQIESLKQMQKEIGMTSDELFVFREVQKSIANKDLPETTAEIEQLARALVQAKNNISDAELAFSNAFTGTSNAVAEYDQWIDSVWRAANQAQILEQEMQRVNYAMEMGDLDESTARAYLKMLEDQIEGLKEKSEDSNIFGGMAGDLREGILAFREFGEEGTKEYKRLTRAAQVFAAAQAFATGNILAGFAQVASVLGSIGSGDLKDISAEVQATQNLNVWGDKADSISRSMQITANATDKLVGINTSMLKALQVMQQGIAKASGLIVRDSVTPQINTGALGIMDNPLMDNALGKVMFGFMDKLTFGMFGFVGKLFGGKSKVVDEGIRIIGGSMADMMEDVLVQGYQQVDYKKWRFGSKKSKTQFSNMDSSVGDQFSLVFGSIADSVYEGATMLGLSGSAVEEAINNFTIATKKISLKGLSAEQQQKEIEAYFSQIFDGLALEVVGFLPEFQKAGEGYGEALSRIATQVAVLDGLSTRFGINFGDKMANPELYAKAADNIATLTGGLEEFINKTAGFTRFADEATQIEIAQNDLNRALSEVGLSLPSSTAGMWELMQSIDGSTEAGQNQIATLLNLQDSSYAYYQMLERQNEQYKNLSRNLRGIIESTYGLSGAAAQTSLDAAIAAAKLGDFGLALSGNFAAAMPKQSDFESFADFAFEQAVTANKLEELAKLSDGQISVEERQLSQLEQINQALRESYTSTQSNEELVRATKGLNVTQQKTNEILHKISRSTEASEKIQRAMVE